MSSPTPAADFLYDHTEDWDSLFQAVILEDADPRVNASIILQDNDYLFLQPLRHIDVHEEIVLQRSSIDALPEQVQTKFENYWPALEGARRE
jgi:hypothetical protein